MLEFGLCLPLQTPTVVIKVVVHDDTTCATMYELFDRKYCIPLACNEAVIRQFGSPPLGHQEARVHPPMTATNYKYLLDIEMLEKPLLHLF